MKGGRPPDTYSIPRSSCLVEIGRPRTAEEALILYEIAQHMVALPTNDFQVGCPGNHAVAFIGRNPYTTDRYLVSASHAFGSDDPNRRVLHPYHGGSFVPDYSEIARWYPDTATIALKDDDVPHILGIPLGTHIPGALCWVVTMRYDGNGTFPLQMAADEARVTSRYSNDKNGLSCPIITCQTSRIEIGNSGSVVVQIDPDGLMLAVGALHGLSIEEEIMFSPNPSVLHQSIPGNYVG